MFCTLYQNRMNQEITAMPIRVMSDTSEVVPYQNPRIPIFIGGTRVSNSVKDRMLCHWHEDMEMLLVTDGVLTYSVNGEKYRLKKDEGVVVNSRQLHYGYSVDTKGADYLCVLCSPSLLSGSKEIYDDILRPFFEKGADCYLIWTENDSDLRIAQMIRLMHDAGKNGMVRSVELSIIGMTHLVIAELLNRNDSSLGLNLNASESEIKSQKDMVAFVSSHYGEKITLEQIAEAGNVCRSSCCKLFKKYQGSTPIEYLNDFRIKMSMNQLKHTDRSITEIAFLCGFRHSSYYTEMFRKSTGVTPGQFRKDLAASPEEVI